MKTTAICLIALALLAGLTLAAPDSLRSQMMDWMDVEGASMYYTRWENVFAYSGTAYWDLAMGDSFLVWLPGTENIYLINPFTQLYIDTLFSYSPGTPWNITASSIEDSFLYTTEGRDIVRYRLFADSLDFRCFYHVPFASFFYAEIEDTFLYTKSTGVIYCLNIANPESMFIAWTLGSISGGRGFSVVDGNAYQGSRYNDIAGDYGTYRSFTTLQTAINLDSPSPSIDSSITFPNREGGDIGGSDSLLFYVDTYLSDWDVETETGYEFGETRLGIWGSDYSYTWSEPDDEIAIGVDVLNDKILAVGFEHGFSIINYQQLDGMREVAYYRDTDSTFGFSHFALKENRLFAVAHPHWGVCRLYMFALDSTVISGISEPAPAKPAKIAISAWPNPFNSAVTIAIDIPVGDGSPIPISVEIYDVSGRRVSVIGNYDQPVIARRVQPDEAISYGCEKDCFGQSPRNDNAGEVVWRPEESLPSGLYLLRARSAGKEGFDKLSHRDVGGFVATARIVYLK